MSETDEAIIEAMARAMCVALGEDPDDRCILDNFDRGRRWQNYSGSARAQLAAHRAMIKAEKEQGV